MTDKDQLTAQCWHRLMELVGDPRDGSNTLVTLGWDDATTTPFIRVGHPSKFGNSKDYHDVERGTFENIILGI